MLKGRKGGGLGLSENLNIRKTPGAGSGQKMIFALFRGRSQTQH